MEKINPLQYITDRDPIDEVALDSSKWFKTERMELDFGEYVGKPGGSVMRVEMLTYFFANGWYVEKLGETVEGGDWISVSLATSQQSSASSSNSSNTAQSTHSAKTSSSARNSSNSNANSEATSTSYPSGEGSQGHSSGQSHGNSSGEATASGESNGGGTSQGRASGTGTSSSSSTSEVKSGGAPYWYAYQRIGLVRRRMQPELILKDMLGEFTKAYNEGRRINDERYDELVALYALMLSRTEDEANAFAGLSMDDFKPLVDEVMKSVKDALEQYKGSVGDIPSDWMKSRIDEINRKFDALVAEAKARMVSNGTYNGTVWPTTLSGIERDRQIALDDLRDKMVDGKIDAYGKIAQMTADLGGKILDVATRMIDALNKSILQPTELRNTVFKWMLDFMERREDDYPDLGQLVTISDKLGYADGTMTGGS